MQVPPEASELTNTRKKRGNGTMKLGLGGLAAILGCSALCLVLPASGQYYGPYTGAPLSNGETVSVQYTGGYTDTFGSFGAGIYAGSVNGNATGVICDDFSDQISTSTPAWTANATQASSLTAANLGDTLFGSTIGLTGYAQVATLVSMMFGNGTYGGHTYTQGEISSAIWDITTKGGISGLDAAANALVALLKTNITSSKASSILAGFTNLWILTPNPNIGPGHEPGQEFWIQTVPEGGAALMYLLLAGFTCFGAMFISSRNQLRNRVTV